MEKITIDYSDNASFKGARILYSYLEEGLKIVRNKKIKDVCIWQGLDNTRYSANFDFLKNLEFIETFKWSVNLLKKSNIDGIYLLTNLLT